MIISIVIFTETTAGFCAIHLHRSKGAKYVTFSFRFSNILNYQPRRSQYFYQDRERKIKAMKNTRYYCYNEENDELPYDDGMPLPADIYSGVNSTQPLDREEAQAYSSVYDMPVSAQIKKQKPKQ